MSSNPNCIDQSCYENCCNRYGYCIDRYSYSSSYNTCYYYYSSSSGSFPTYAIPIIVVGTFLIVLFFVIMCCCYLKRREQHGMPYITGPAGQAAETNNRLENPDFPANQAMYNELQGNNFQGGNNLYLNNNVGYPVKNDGWKPQGYGEPVQYPDINNQYPNAYPQSYQQNNYQ